MFLLLIALVTLAVVVAQGQRDRAVRLELTDANVLAAETRLSQLGYWTGPIDGRLDTGTRHALTAFQKVEGRRRTGRLTRSELRALLAAKQPTARETSYAHIEIDLTRQVLFFVDAAGQTNHILPVCTGNEKPYMDHNEAHIAHTPRGRFKVLRKVSGWRLSSLGLLHYPNYIHEGIAIHGSLSVPAYPASHGCIRVPMFVSKQVSQMSPVGTEVLIYD